MFFRQQTFLKDNIADPVCPPVNGRSVIGQDRKVILFRVGMDGTGAMHLTEIALDLRERNAAVTVFIRRIPGLEGQPCAEHAGKISAAGQNAFISRAAAPEPALLRAARRTDDLVAVPFEDMAEFVADALGNHCAGMARVDNQNLGSPDPFKRIMQLLGGHTAL